MPCPALQEALVTAGHSEADAAALAEAAQANRAAPLPFSDNYDFSNNVDDISADGTLGWSWTVGPTTQPFLQLSSEVVGPATFWALAIQAPYDPPNPYAGTVGWPGTATVGSVPAGQWDENPPPVPDVGATIYAGEQQTSAKPSDASTARQPGDVPGDGTNPAAQSPLSASRKSMDGMLSPPRDFGTRGRHPSGAELMGLTPGTSTQQVEESYQRLGGPRPNDPPGTQSNPSSPTWWAAIVGGADAALSGTVNVVGGILSTLAEVPAAIIDVGGIATEATARATFNTNWTYSPLSSSGQDEGGSFSEKAKNRAWEYAQQVATLGTKEFDEAYQEYLETGDATRMQNSAGNLAGNAIGAKVGGRIIGKVREVAARGSRVAAPEGSAASGALPEVPANPQPGTLSNVQARTWYLANEAAIPEMIDSALSLEQQARQAFNIRNQLRTRARKLMADRAEAARLEATEPNLTWEQIVARYEGRGLQGDALYQEIINAAQRSRARVNQALGIDPNKLQGQ